jgi:RNA polymerase sigma-70 factor (ECF subfamily)
MDGKGEAITPPMTPDATPPATPDAELVAAVLGGDSGDGSGRAFDELVQRYDRSARATCFGVLRDWHLARDAAQEGFVAAYTNLRLLREPASFGPWLLTIMRHRATRMARHRTRRVAPLHLVPDPVAATTAPATDPDTEALLAAVAALPEHERAVVMLRYFDGHPVSAIAQICGRPLTTVKKQLSRAHDRLRGLLEKGERR